jgi:hypothetical protein
VPQRGRLVSEQSVEKNDNPTEITKNCIDCGIF